MKDILEVEKLTICFPGREQAVKALDNVSFSIGKGKIVGVIGETGSGKTVLAQALLGLIDSPGWLASGKILFQGKDILSMNDSEKRKIYGKHVSIILSDPYGSFNPLFTIGNQLVEIIRQNEKISRKAARTHAAELLARVGIPSPALRLNDYPFQFSGGMLQRASIAIAILSKPDLIVADNPTQALDVTIQAQILELLDELQQTLNTTIVLISHDLGVIASLANEVFVLSQGKILESGKTEQVLKQPTHRYTQALLKSIPSLTGSRLDQLPTIKTLLA